MSEGYSLPEQAEAHLQQALSECSEDQKNYHIRSALQACYIQAPDETGDSDTR